MLFQSSIRKELARSFGATLVILVTIVMTIVLIRSLGQASRGYINPRDVLLYMAYSGLGRLPTILSLSLFVAMVGTLSRMYRESEMVVWFTSGQSIAELLKPLFRFAWPVLLIIALLSLFVWPWTNQQTQDMRAQFESRSDLDRIAPGQFQESSNGNRVFFIDKDTTAEGKASNNVFIASNEKGKSAITTARSGRIETKGADQMLILENGQRVESASDRPSMKVSDFKEYGVRTGEAAAPANDIVAAKLIPTQDLLLDRTRANMSELAWRLGLVFSAINFVVLSVALSSVNPRSGRGGSLIFVLLTFVVYNNLLNLGQSWIFVGLIGFSQFLLALHGGVLLLALGWLIKRNANWKLRLGLSLFTSRAARARS